jgi:hypothetical protein
MTPVLKVAMHRAVIAELLRQVVPLAAGPQAKDDAIEDPPQVHPPMSFGLSWIMGIQNLLDHRPDVVWNFPDGRLLLLLGLLLALGNPPFSEGGSSLD